MDRIQLVSFALGIVALAIGCIGAYRLGYKAAYREVHGVLLALYETLKSMSPDTKEEGQE